MRKRYVEIHVCANGSEPRYVGRPELAEEFRVLMAARFRIQVTAGPDALGCEEWLVTEKGRRP